MKLRHLFTVNLFFAIFFGFGCAVFPVLIHQMYDISPTEGSIWVTRLVGGSILGFGTLMWFGRKTKNIDARRAIALALFAQDSIGTIASVEIQLSGVINTFGWSNIVLYGLLSLAYAYFLFIRPADC